jgi:hypothetical protein
MSVSPATNASGSSAGPVPVGKAERLRRALHSLYDLQLWTHREQHAHPGCALPAGVSQLPGRCASISAGSGRRSGRLYEHTTISRARLGEAVTAAKRSPRRGDQASKANFSGAVIAECAVAAGCKCVVTFDGTAAVTSGVESLTKRAVTCPDPSRAYTKLHP